AAGDSGCRARRMALARRNLSGTLRRALRTRHALHRGPRQHALLHQLLRERSGLAADEYTLFFVRGEGRALPNSRPATTLKRRVATFSTVMGASTSSGSAGIRCAKRLPWFDGGGRGHSRTGNRAPSIGARV